MAKLNSQIIDDYYLADNQEIELWEKSIFVFDTSALLQFYYYSDNARKNIFETIFDILKGRLWIPFHVGYEFLNNRKSTIKKPYTESYIFLENEILKKIQEEIKSIISNVGDFQRRTKSTETHPFIDTKIIDTFIREAENFNKSYQEFETKTKQEFETRKKEINSMLDNDIVLIAIKKYFASGDDYSFTKIMEIVADGELRYRNNIPPGYKDENRKDGTQRYGDLIIWKQIIDYAKKTKKPIIFITNDTKDDWAITEKHDNEKRIARPREELVKEMKDNANVAFWMYSLDQFIYKAQEILNSQIETKVLEEVEKVKLAKYRKDQSSTRLHPLSKREMEVLSSIARGMSNKEIALSLGISHQTVKNHVTAILRKFGVADRTQATVYALQKGWVRLQDIDEYDEDDEFDADAEASRAYWEEYERNNPGEY